MEHIFTTENFEAEVLKAEVPVLVDFYADWCGPCKMMAPIMKAIAEKSEGIYKVGKINIDDHRGVAEKYKVMSIPTFILFKNGEVKETIVGGMTQKELENKVEQALI